MIRNLLKPLSFIPALLLMYMIFSFSAQEGDVSSQLSYQASVKIVEAADYIFDANLDYYQIDEWANKINFITRKLAHMTEYFALAVAVSFPLYVYGMHGILLMLVAGMICVGFACGDEYHQSFVAGRSPSTRDICIDSVGVFIGIILVRIIGWTGRKTIFRPKKKKEKFSKRKSKKHNNDYYEDYYEAPPQNGPYYQMPPQNGPYYQAPPRQTAAPLNPNDKFWSPEQEIQFDPSQVYQKPSEPQPNEHLENDWGFQESEQAPAQSTRPQNMPPKNIPPQNIPPQNPVSQPVKKKKREKDWFFDL